VSQIKLTAGGGVSSPFSPSDAVTFTEPELRAAVEGRELGHIRRRACLYASWIMKDGKIHKNLVGGDKAKPDRASR
jgi:hypothetical protein